MKTRSIICALVAALLLTGCGETPHKVRTLELTPEEKVIKTNQNGFTLDLLKQVSATETESENVFLSPLSVAIVGAMVANGAEGETLNQILRTIGAGDYSVDDLNAYYKNLLENLPYLDKYTDMKLADAIWVDNDCKVKDAFVKVNKDYYKAKVQNADLADPATAKQVNNWANQNTKGLIPKVVDESIFNENLRMILANAIYFKSKWSSPFDSRFTEERDFTRADGSQIDVKMMNNGGEMYVTPTSDARVFYFSYDGSEKQPAEADTTHYDARMLRLYFKNGAYCADFILPRRNLSVETYLEGLDLEELADLQGRLGLYEVEIQVPKCKLKYHRDLNEDMQALGMGDVFSSNANLSGISTQESLRLDRLFQDSYMEMDEEGVKAAAVSVGLVEATAALDSSPRVDPFILDRPFLLLIREVKYGTILFAGKIGNPAQ
ncbi:MAG: serpin family protein [Paludibacteraceae bacterium]|nr:serpin family protein [Paludibacteraceae bacterium]